MRILSRYIFKEVFQYFAICLLIFTSLILTARTLKFTDLIVNKGVDFLQIVKVFLSIVPTFLEIALPLSVLLGVMLGVARLSGDSEMIIFRATGIKLVKLLRPILIFGLLVTAGAYYLTLELRPFGYRTLNTTLFQIAKERSLASLTPGMFNTLGSLTIYAEQIDYRTGGLKKVLIEDRRDEQAVKTIFAKTGQILGQEGSESLLIALQEGSIHQEINQQYEVTKFTNNQMFLAGEDLYGDIVMKKDQKGRGSSNLELKNDISEINKQLKNKALLATSSKAEIKNLNKQLRRLRLEKSFRLTTPWVCLLMAVLGVCLGIMPPRTQKSWGASFSLSLGLGAFISYFAIFTVMKNLGESGSLPIFMSAILPVILLAIFTFYLFRKLNNERIQSVADLVPAVTDNFKFIFRRFNDRS